MCQIGCDLSYSGLAPNHDRARHFVMWYWSVGRNMDKRYIDGKHTHTPFQNTTLYWLTPMRYRDTELRPEKSGETGVIKHRVKRFHGVLFECTPSSPV